MNNLSFILLYLELLHLIILIKLFLLAVELLFILFYYSEEVNEGFEEIKEKSNDNYNMKTEE